VRKDTKKVELVQCTTLIQSNIELYQVHKIGRNPPNRSLAALN